MRRGFTLVSTLVTLALILMLVVVYTTGGLRVGQSSRPDGKGVTTLGAAQMRAFDTQCTSNLRQVRQAIQVVSNMGEDGYPQSLNETRLGRDFLACPIGKEPYQYDPATGQVRCPHPGHENY